MTRGRTIPTNRPRDQRGLGSAGKLDQTQIETVLNLLSSWAERKDRETFAKAHTRETLFKKFVSKRSDSARSNAIATFRSANAACCDANRKMRRGSGRLNAFSEEILFVASRKIAAILGPFSWGAILDHAQHGPGSTFHVKGSDVGLPRKFEATDVTFDFHNIASILLTQYPLWCSYLTGADSACPILCKVPGGRLATVPKTNLIDRCIVVEPTINAFFQQGCGRYIRSRLLKFGVDLNSQQLNQRLARWGSVYDDIATVDLTSASDLISTLVVRELLPPDWFNAMDIMRSKHIRIDGSWVRAELFSSMGNGFTFDLESLIFYALSHAITVVRGYNPFWVNVFGDDIVVPSGVFDDVLSVFTDLGFKVNVEKSYKHGPFRESCGHDYYNGLNVRGVYLRRLATVHDLCKIHNRLREWSLRTGESTDELRRKIRSVTHLSSLLTPPSFGDIGFASSFDEACPVIARQKSSRQEFANTERFGFCGFYFDCLEIIPPKRYDDSTGLLLAALTMKKSAGNEYVLRGDEATYPLRMTRLYTLNWE